MKDLILKLKISSQKHKTFLFLFLGFIIIYIFSSLNQTQKQISNQQITPDTLIPKGHVLVPIELENIDAITGLIEHYGVIDIYSAQSGGQKSYKLLNKVKIIRAPYNPNKFAILLKDVTAKYFFKFNGPFVGTVQNKSEAESNPEVKNEIIKNNRKIKIEYSGV